MKKKLLAIILMLAMAAALIPAFSAQAVYAADIVDEFPDATGDSVNKTAYNSIYWAVGQGIINGFSDGTFGPDESCTRAQFVVMVWRLSGKPEPASTSSAGRFSDVNGLSGGMLKAISWAVEKGIISGFNDGTFRPDDTVTRRQSAVMLWRMAGKPAATATTSFSDISSGETTYPAIQWGASVGLIKGFSDGTFGPEQNCLRQQIVIFLYRYADNVEGKEMVIPEIKKIDGSTAPAEEPTPAQPAKQTYYRMTKRTKTLTDLAAKQVVNYEYDSLGRLTRAFSSTADVAIAYESNGDIKYSGTRYDSNGAVNEKTDRVIGQPNGIKSEIAYDVNGKITGKTTYEYDAQGNQLKTTTENMITNTVSVTDYVNTYSGSNLTKVVVKTDGAVTRTSEYVYSSNGELFSANEYDDSGKITWSMEISGNTTIYKNYDNGVISSESSYTHTATGDEDIYYSYVEGVKTLSNRSTAKFNASGDMTERTNYDADNKVTWKEEYKYNPDGTLSEQISSDGTSQTDRMVYKYKDGKLVEVCHVDAAGTETGQTYITYDANGNIIRENYTGAGIVMEYEYKAFELEENPEEYYIPEFVNMYFPLGAWSY